MILLLDAHALLWWMTDSPTLSTAARQAIAAPANDVVVSAATIWELAIKRALGKLPVPGDVPAALERAGFGALAITGADAESAAALEAHHRDPFDRMLIAQALRLDAVIVSRDRAFAAYRVPQLLA